MAIMALPDPEREDDLSPLETEYEQNEQNEQGDSDNDKCSSNVVVGIADTCESTTYTVEEKACSGLFYPEMLTISMILTFSDLFTDVWSAFQNISYFTSERIAHGILILVPIVTNVVVHHGSDYYRKQTYLLKFSAEEQTRFDSWWLKFGFFDPCYWTYKHIRATGDRLRDESCDRKRRAFYLTKQMMQLSTKVEAQMESTFQAALTLFRILYFFREAHLGAFDFWLSIVSLIFSCLSIGRAASSDLLKTNIKGENPLLIQNSEKGLDVTVNEENAKVYSFCTKQPTSWKIARIATLSFQTGATLLANVTFIWALYLGWTQSCEEFKQHLITTLNASVDTLVSAIEPFTTASLSKPFFPPCTLSNSTTPGHDPMPSVASAFIGLLLILVINTFVNQLVWGIIASKEYFLSDMFNSCPQHYPADCHCQPHKETWTTRFYFLARSPFICIFRSASVFHYSLPKSILTVLLMHNTACLILLMVPAFVFHELVGLTLIVTFWVILTGYVICSVICSNNVIPIDLETIHKDKKLVMQRIAQLP